MQLSCSRSGLKTMHSEKRFDFFSAYGCARAGGLWTMEQREDWRQQHDGIHFPRRFTLAWFWQSISGPLFVPDNLCFRKCLVLISIFRTYTAISGILCDFAASVFKHASARNLVPIGPQLFITCLIVSLLCCLNSAGMQIYLVAGAKLGLFMQAMWLKMHAMIVVMKMGCLRTSHPGTSLYEQSHWCHCVCGHWPSWLNRTGNEDLKNDSKSALNLWALLYLISTTSF